MSKSIQIFGFHSLEAQLETNPECILKVLIQTGRDDRRATKLTSLLDKHQINYTHIEKRKLDRLTKGEAHQGVVADITLPTAQGQDALIKFIVGQNKAPLILMLDSIQDPRNLGACLRSANAAGVDCVVLNKDGSAPINALVHKTSAGALNQLKIFQVTNLVRAIKAIQELSLWVVGFDGAAQDSLYQLNLVDPSVLVMGNEGKGLRRLVKDTCDQLVKIPMQGQVESLNVSVATGIALFEASRQRES